jgi:glutamate-5-semialdehyde dehydrogenase
MAKLTATTTGDVDAAVRAEVERVVIEARRAARQMANAPTDRKNAALRGMAQAIGARTAQILAANGADVDAATRGGVPAAMVDRLTLTEKRLAEMVASLDAVAQLPDPVGEVLRMWRRPNGLQIGKARVPIGVIAIIYESRPNVTSECASLCLKSGNAVVLRGGQEAFNSNRAIVEVLREATTQAGLPAAAIGFIPTPERAGIDVLLRMDQAIDLVIPRGGEALIRKVVETSTIPVIKHAKGVCHVYVDESADLAMAQRIAVNAKCQRPATCNAMETLLVHQSVAGAFLPVAVAELRRQGTEIRGCERTRALVPGVAAATEEDWSAEYLDLILAVRVVDSFDAAIEHIATYGSSHSDAIVTTHHARAMRFLREVDSAAVYVNASTRFTDGFQFGLGAEIGISTDKLHARGPMGLEELTTYKYLVFGDGQVRE